MQWLNKIVDEIMARQPDGELLVESGVSPSGTYHMGHLREVMIADVVAFELRRRGRQARHVHFVDDMDGLRKIPHNVPQEFEQYLGIPYCDIPAPDGSDRTYADFFFDPFLEGTKTLGLEMEVVRSHEKYRSGFFVPAIERVAERLQQTREACSSFGRKLDDNWSPFQVVEQDGRLKKRQFVGIDTEAKILHFQRPDGSEGQAHYDRGEVALDWRVDWPARWWLLGINAEPFGRDHATKGGSYDTGAMVMKEIFDATAPLPVPYDFINRTGDTKKMSASKGTGIDFSEMTRVLPAEIINFFTLRYSPDKLLFFDQSEGVVRLVDDFAALAAKPDKTEGEQQLLELCTRERPRTISRVPFSHLVASYQAALKDVDKTLEIIRRTEYSQIVDEDADVITKELHFIDQWLKHWAPAEVRFDLRETLDAGEFTLAEQNFLKTLGDKVATAPADADGAWFHAAIYELRDQGELTPKEMFSAIYRALINKTSGPRAGWFLSILPREWLVQRLHLEG